MSAEYPVMYSEAPRGEWRHGVEESEIESCLWFFYQDKDYKTGDWQEKRRFDLYVNVQTWEAIKRSAKTLFAHLVGEDESKDLPYSSPEFKIFDDNSSYCTVVTESADCPGNLELDYQAWDPDEKVYRSRCDSFGAFDKDEWERFAAVVDKFIAEVF